MYLHKLNIVFKCESLKLAYRKNNDVFIPIRMRLKSLHVNVERKKFLNFIGMKNWVASVPKTFKHTSYTDMNTITHELHNTTFRRAADLRAVFLLGNYRDAV